MINHRVITPHISLGFGEVYTLPQVQGALYQGIAVGYLVRSQHTGVETLQTLIYQDREDPRGTLYVRVELRAMGIQEVRYHLMAIHVQELMPRAHEKAWRLLTPNALAFYRDQIHLRTSLVAI